MSFTPIPSIDILNGSCVRLQQGDYNHATIYREDPVEVAVEFAEVCERIHVVDLDGAMKGSPQHLQIMERIVKETGKVRDGAKIQVGGGLRTIEDIKATLDIGVAMVVLGTAAIRDPDFLSRACKEFPGKVLLSLDARNNKLAVSGWTEDTDMDAVEFAGKVSALGVAGIIYTDINRDGTLDGANIEATASLAEKVDCPVYASGGISSSQDLRDMGKTGISGAIIGKAIYTDRIQIKDLASEAIS